MKTSSRAHLALERFFCEHATLSALFLAGVLLPVLAQTSFGQGMDVPAAPRGGVENERNESKVFSQTRILREPETESPEVRGRTLQQELGLSSFAVSQLERALGVLLGDVEVRIEDYNMPTGIRYARVKTVQPGQLAARNGLKAGDMILACNGHAVNGAKSLAAAMGQLPLHATAVWEIARAEEPLEVRFLVSDVARNSKPANMSVAPTAKTSALVQPAAKKLHSKPSPKKTTKSVPLKSAPARELNRMLDALKGL